MKAKVSSGIVDGVVSYSPVRHSDFRGHLTKPFSQREEETPYSMSGKFFFLNLIEGYYAVCIFK